MPDVDRPAGPLRRGQGEKRPAKFCRPAFFRQLLILLPFTRLPLPANFCYIQLKQILDYLCKKFCRSEENNYELRV